MSKLLIGGKWVDGESAGTLRDKFSGAVYGEMAIASPAQIEAAVAGAVSGQAASKLARYDRYRILSAAARILEAGADGSGVRRQESPRLHDQEATPCGLRHHAFQLTAQHPRAQGRSRAGGRQLGGNQAVGVHAAHGRRTLQGADRSRPARRPAGAGTWRRWRRRPAAAGGSTHRVLCVHRQHPRRTRDSAHRRLARDTARTREHRQHDRLDEAVARANAQPFGLSVGMFTSSLHAAFSAANELRFGGIHINEASSARVNVMPFGGVKDSGFGLEGPACAIREMTEERLVTASY